MYACIYVCIMHAWMYVRMRCSGCVLVVGSVPSNALGGPQAPPVQCESYSGTLPWSLNHTRAFHGPSRCAGQRLLAMRCEDTSVLWADPLVRQIARIGHVHVHVSTTAVPRGHIQARIQTIHRRRIYGARIAGCDGLLRILSAVQKGRGAVQKSRGGLSQSARRVSAESSARFRRCRPPAPLPCGAAALPRCLWRQRCRCEPKRACAQQEQGGEEGCGHARHGTALRAARPLRCGDACAWACRGGRSRGRRRRHRRRRTSPRRCRRRRTRAAER